MTAKELQDLYQQYTNQPIATTTGSQQQCFPSVTVGSGQWTYQAWPPYPDYEAKYNKLRQMLPQMICLLLIIDRVIDHADETTKAEFRLLQDDLYKTASEIIDERT